MRASRVDSPNEGGDSLTRGFGALVTAARIGDAAAENCPRTAWIAGAAALALQVLDGRSAWGAY